MILCQTSVLVIFPHHKDITYADQIVTKSNCSCYPKTDLSYQAIRICQVFAKRKLKDKIFHHSREVL